MPSRHLTYEHANGGTFLTYTPVAIGDFKDVRILVPSNLSNDQEEAKTEIADEVIPKLRDACGVAACGASLVFEQGGTKAICFEKYCSMDS